MLLHPGFSYTTYLPIPFPYPFNLIGISEAPPEILLKGLCAASRFRVEKEAYFCFLALPVMGTKRTPMSLSFSMPFLVLVIRTSSWKKLPTGAISFPPVFN